MDQEIIDALKASGQRLEEWNGTLRPGSLGRAKNNDVLDMINRLVPKKQISLDARQFDPELVYPNRN